MKYKLTHQTNYIYSDPVPVSHNILHLTPRTIPHQKITDHRLLIHPEPAFRGKRKDYFGNPVDFFSIHEAHNKLTVTSTSRLEVLPLTPPLRSDLSQSPPWETVVEHLRTTKTKEVLRAYQFVFDSPNVRSSEALADYARISFSPHRPILEAAADLTRRIHEEFTYDATSTHVHTQLEEVLRERKGVCQDFAHIQLGFLRSLGLAARYVSGYLRTNPPEGRPRLIGADASHAWVSVFAGELGWVDFDPTNNVTPSEDHITLAWGRDYSDVCPIQGVFVGGGQHSMSVSVDVAPLDEKPL